MTERGKKRREKAVGLVEGLMVMEVRRRGTGTGRNCHMWEMYVLVSAPGEREGGREREVVKWRSEE